MISFPTDEMDGRDYLQSRFDPLTFRFYMSDALIKMKYGEAINLPSYVIEFAWPPTGDYDRSIDAAIHAMFLSAGGHRPETSMTSLERIQGDLDETFGITERRYDREWVIYRKLSSCPRCRGSGVIRVAEEVSKLCPIGPADISASSMAAVKTIPCEHLP